MRAVLFDLDGTLVELPDDFADLFETALRDHGIGAGEDRYDCYLEAFFEYLDACHPEPYRMAMADLRDRFGLDIDAAALAETYTRCEAERTELRPGVREALDALDCPLGVLTNGAARAQRRKLAHHGLAEAFDAVVVSGAVGAAKPDSAIFGAAKEAVPADQHVFVADDLERDVLPAQAVGFTGVYLAEGGADSDDRADRTVRSIRDVPRVID